MTELPDRGVAYKDMEDEKLDKEMKRRWKTLLKKLATIKRKHNAPRPYPEYMRWEECIERHKKYRRIG